MEEEEVEDMEVVTELEEEAIVVREVEDTIPREAAEALLIKKLGNCGYWNIHFSHSKKANECGNIVVVLFHTSFVKEASFLNRMNYLHGKSIHAQLQCSSIRFL